MVDFTFFMSILFIILVLTCLTLAYIGMACPMLLLGISMLSVIIAKTLDFDILP